MRCNQKESGARRQTKLGCGPSEAWQRRGWLFLVATRREGHESRATRCCVSSQGPGLGVVTRLDWRGGDSLRTGKNWVNRPLASSNNSFYLAARPFVQAHPQVLRVLFDELSRADRLAQEARKDAIKLIADFSGLDAGVVSLFIQRRPSSPVDVPGPTTVADQQRVADAFFKLGLIPNPVNVADFVWRPVARS